MNGMGFLLLCGGKSERMGQCKALLDWNGAPLMDWVAGAGADFAERIISVNLREILTPPGFTRVADLIPACGPMSGLHAALTRARSDALVVAPCDAPYYTRALARYLCEAFTPGLDALAVCGRDGRPHPLIGVYAKSCLLQIEGRLRQGDYKLSRLLGAVKHRIIPLPEGMDEAALVNLNTPADVQNALLTRGMD